MASTPLLTLIHIDTGVRFYHQSDERAFFEWLTRIPCVQGCKGQGNRGLVVRLKRKPGNDDLRQLLALCLRYGVDMKQLAKFETTKNRSWFRDTQKYWYRGVFGSMSKLLEETSGEDQPVVQLSAAEEASLAESLAEADLGEFATDEHVRAIWAKYDL